MPFLPRTSSCTTRHGSPSSPTYNVKTISRYSTLPVGFSFEVCSSAPTPAGWTKTDERWDSTRCEHPTSPWNNVKRIRRDG